MSEPEEERFADLVRRQAPPARDPMFRIQVLERRENEQFRSRSYLYLAGAGAVLVLAAVAIFLRPDSLGDIGVLIAVAIAVAGCLFYGPALSRRLGDLRRQYLKI